MKLNFGLPGAVSRLFWFSLAVKIVIGALLPLSLDESYYWMWGHHLQLSYFDHPPMAGWLFKSGQIFSSIGHLDRLPGIILGQLTLLAWIRILKDFFNAHTSWQLIFMGLYLTSPLMGLGSLILTPDLPLMFFWSWSLYLLCKVPASNRPNALLIAMGALLGLGFCAKYHIALFLPLALLALALTKNLKARLLPGIVGGFVVFLIFSSPVLYWNYQHEWISFKFQLDHGLGNKSFKWEWPALYLLGQIMILFPTTLFMAIKATLKKADSFYHVLLAVFTWAPLLFFFYSSTRSPVEANWTIIAIPCALCLAASWGSKNTSWAWTSILFWAALTTVIFIDAFFNILNFAPYDRKSREFYKYNGPVAYIKENPTDVYFARTFQMASNLSYRTGQFVYKIRGINRYDFFDMIPESLPNASRPFKLFLKAEELVPDIDSVKGFRLQNRTSVSEHWDVLTWVPL